MAEILGELVKILKTETALYRRLLEVLGREHTALLRSRLSEIQACGADKRELIERLQAIERQRMECVDRLARSVDRPAAEVTLSLLARTTLGSRGSELRHLRTELLGLVERVKEETQRSEILCRHVGEWLKAAYGVLKGMAANGCVYHRGGRMQGARLNGKLVCDEI
jgi:flagellar biosynthesis/type III secretory pathway chaperone